MSVQGKLSGNRTADYCLFVGKSQWGRQSPSTPREVWIGELAEALRRRLVERCEMSLGGRRVTGYVPAGQARPQIIATDALPSGRIEVTHLVDNEGYDRNSTIWFRLEELDLRIVP